MKHSCLILFSILFLSIMPLAGCGRSPSKDITGKIAFEANMFKLDPEVWGSNDGTCIYKKGKIKKLSNKFLFPRWSRDGKLLMVGEKRTDGRGLAIIDYKTNKVIERIVTTCNNTLPVFFPDNRKIAYVVWNMPDNEPKIPDNIYIYNRATKQEKQVTFFKETNFRIRSFDISPDGKKIVFSRYKIGEVFPGPSDIYILDVTSNTTDIVPLIDGSLVRWSPDGKKIVSAGVLKDRPKDERGGGILLYDLLTKEISKVTFGMDGEMSLSFSPDGKQIAFVSMSMGGGKSLQVINTDGTNRRQIIPPGYNLGNIDWGP